VKQQASPVPQVSLPHVTPLPRHALPRHATHRFVVVSQSGRFATPVQSVLCRHWTQVPFVVSHTGPAAPGPPQFALVRHCSQTPVVVSQWVVGGKHPVSFVHLFTHVWFVVSQTWVPAVQFAVVTHWTQVSVALSQ
jgi:hypothetical protein